MMDSYVDFIVLENSEFTSTTLLNELFALLHLALVKRGPEMQVAANFPKASVKSLGNCLRLHGTAENLQSFMSLNWHRKLIDYLSVSRIANIPSQLSGRTVQVRRVQVKSSAERIRRRYCKRHGVDAAAAEKAIPDSISRRTHLPWIELRSSSTDQRFRLFLEIKELAGVPAFGEFNRYGLSSTALLPSF